MSNVVALKAARIQRVLDLLFPRPTVPLNFVNDFTFLCAVVLSAQTTDGKVNDVTRVLFAKAPTPYELSKMKPSEVEAIIKTVGLAPKKAVYLVELSKKIVSEFGGSVPSTYEELESLPGVGHKTASVIMSQSFNSPAIAVDTHVHRLANRWGLSAEKNVDKVQRDLMAIFPQDRWNKVCALYALSFSPCLFTSVTTLQLHLQMIYFGREYCTAKDHKVNKNYKNFD